jgi:uncharacterized protein DUF4382
VICALDHASRSILQFGLIGLALAGGLLAVLQVRPMVVLPFNGTFSVQVQSPYAQLSPAADVCFDCNVTSLRLTIDSVTVHREGELNLTGGWLQISQSTTVLNTSGITGIGQLIGQASLPPGKVNLIRLNVSSASAEEPGTGPVQLSFPSGRIDVVLSPSGEVKSGRVTTVFLIFPLRISCGGNGDCRLKPVTVARVSGPE